LAFERVEKVDRHCGIQPVSNAFNDNIVLEDFSAVFPAGKVTLHHGPSGFGKTTLLNILMDF
jgi:ABC-type multidrug transport system ATPase subunit